MFDPWRRLGELANWTLKWALLPADILATTCHATFTIQMDRRLLQAERRSTLAHELEHVERGPLPADPTLAAREERWVEEAAARKMITLEALGEALAWAHDWHELADELWVDVKLAKARVEHLHPSERHYLRRRLGNTQ